MAAPHQGDRPLDAARSQLEMLLDLDARHDDLLERLDELDRRVERVLVECTPARGLAADGPGTDHYEG